MKKYSLALNLLLLGATLLLNPANLAQTCPKGNTQFSAYMQRDNDPRCEGVKSIEIAGSFELVAFSRGHITSLSQSLKIEVPKQSDQPPKVRVRSLAKNYQLDPLKLTPTGSTYQFNWSNYVLSQENIDPQSLRATAFINSGQLIYLPVIFCPAPKYDIILHSDRRAKISEFKILKDNITIYSTSRPDFQPKGQILFTWNGRTKDGKSSDLGLYELRVTAQLERDDAPPETATINITFAHNPQWLK
jgi:flagellar basal-body rod modification protein FlgD